MDDNIIYTTPDCMCINGKDLGMPEYAAYVANITLDCPDHAHLIKNPEEHGYSLKNKDDEDRDYVSQAYFEKILDL